MTIELKMLAFTVLLGLIQLLAAAHLATMQRGLKWNLSPRDSKLPELTGVAGRMDRALKNLLETFGFFAAAVLCVQLAGRASDVSALGAQIYFYARVVYVPAYAAGIPIVRTLIWGASLIGLVMVLSALL